MELTENMKTWLNELFDKAIVEANDAANREMTLAECMSSRLREKCRAKAEERLAYAAKLEELKDNIPVL